MQGPSTWAGVWPGSQETSFKGLLDSGSLCSTPQHCGWHLSGVSKAYSCLSEKGEASKPATIPWEYSMGPPS